MLLIINISISLADFSSGKSVLKPMDPGTYEVERIKNPFVPEGEPWLAIKGKKLGGGEGWLKSNPDVEVVE